MNLGLLFVLIGFGTYKTVEIVKDAIPWPLHYLTKGALTLITSLLLVLIFLPLDVQIVVVLTLGAAGLSSVLHKFARLCGAMGDDHRQQVIMRAGRGQQNRNRS